jgi:esterase/lipase superfamily enzyme
MNRDYHRWHSDALQRDMELLAFGHAGARVLAFPTARGRFYDWEGHGLVAALGGQLDQGLLQLFCVDSVDAESWFAGGRPAPERAGRHEAYDSYLLAEVLPFTLRRNTNPFLIVAGVDFGAYHAVNFALRHPECVNRVLGLSGPYDVRHFTDGHYDEHVYFNNPVDYLNNEHEPSRLEALRGLDIILAVGRDDPLLSGTENLSGLLWGKDVWHALRVWDGQAHDWPAWQRMLQHYVSGHD